jgi:hypothetical protein
MVAGEELLGGVSMQLQWKLILVTGDLAIMLPDQTRV